MNLVVCAISSIPDIHTVKTYACTNRQTGITSPKRTDNLHATLAFRYPLCSAKPLQAIDVVHAPYFNPTSLWERE
jgi:hypothetical protein